MSSIVLADKSATNAGYAASPVLAERIRVDEAGWLHAIVYVEIRFREGGELVTKLWPYVVSLPPGSVLGIQYSDHTTDPRFGAGDDEVSPAGEASG